MSKKYAEIYLNADKKIVGICPTNSLFAKISDMLHRYYGNLINQQSDKLEFVEVRYYNFAFMKVHSSIKQEVDFVGGVNMSKNNKDMDNNENMQKNRDFNQKASFVAGIVVIFTIINDAIGLITTLPTYVVVIEWVLCILLFFLALGSKIIDKWLCRKGVENFGGFLTVYSIVIFLLERQFSNSVVNKEIELSILNDKMQVFIIFLFLGIMGLFGAIYLLFYKYPKKK